MNKIEKNFRAFSETALRVRNHARGCWDVRNYFEAHPGERTSSSGEFANQAQEIVKVIEIVLLLPCGKKQKRQFKSEAEASEYLTITHGTEAPLSFTYGDGSPVLSPAIERIYDRVFRRVGLS